MSIPVILDTDIGSDIDDTWALAMALGCPEIDLRMVVSATGDTHHRASIVGKMLEQTGRTDIEIGIGIPTDVGPKNQERWVGDYDLSRYLGTVHEDGVAAMADMIMSSSETITLVCIGPLPNIGALLKRAPGVVEKVRFVGMHGSVYKGYFGTEEIHPEYNVKFHLEDAQASLHAAWPVTITPLDTCGTVRLDGELHAAVASAENQSMQAVIGNYKAWLAAINKDEEIAEVKSSVLFDTVAIYLAFAEDLLEVEDLRIRVDDDGYTRIDETGNMMRVATNWRDYDAFLDLLVERLLAAP